MVKPEKTIVTVPHAKIKPDTEQPRKFFDPEKLATLKTSIRENGLQVPISIKPSPTHTVDGTYIIVGGERRWRCCGELDIKEMPCFIMEADTDALIWGLVDNLERENLNAMEEAWGFAKLLERGMTQTQVAKKLSRSNTHISRMILLVKLPEEIQEAVAAKKIAANAGILLVQRCESTEDMLNVYKEFLKLHHAKKDRMTVRALQNFFEKRERLKRLKKKGIDAGSVRVKELAGDLPATATRLFSLLDELIALREEDVQKFTDVWEEIPRAERPRLEGTLRAISTRIERVLDASEVHKSQRSQTSGEKVPLRAVPGSHTT